MKPKSTLRSFLLGCSSLLVVSNLHAADGTWTQITAGPFNWDDIANWSSGAGPIADGADFTASFVANLAAGQTVNLNNPKTIGNITFTDSTTSSHDLTISGANILTLDRTDATKPTINITQSGRTLAINSVIAGGDGMSKTGAGTLQLGGANNYSGGTDISGGRVNAGNNSAMGSGPITVSANATFGAAYNGTGYTLANSLIVNPGVTATLNPGNQFQKLTLTGPVSGSGNVFWETGAGGAAGTLTFSSDSNAITGTITVRSIGNGVGYLTVNSLADSLAANTNPIQLGGSGTYAGAIRLGTGTATPLVFTNRQIDLNSANASGGIIENNNATATNTITINTALLVSANGNKTLTLGGSNTGANTFGGVIGDGVTPVSAVISLTKADAGTWILSNANTYSGATTVSAGTLEIGGSGSLGSGNYAANISNAGTLKFNSSVSQTLGGVISGAGSLVKDNSGSLALTGSTTYTGTTTVTAGTLSLGNGTNNTNLNDFSTLSVASGGAKIDLNYVGSDAVFFLNLGGSPMAVGQYGHTNSGANNGGAGVGFYDAFFAANTGIINNLNGDSTAISVAFWDGGAVDIGSNGNAASAGGAGTWDTTILNWDYGTVAHAAWLNTTSATAIFGGAGGIVTLGADMNIKDLTVSLPSANATAYSIGNVGEDNTLTFGGTKTVTTTATGTGTNQDVTIQAGIAGSPTMNISGRATDANNFSLLPGAGVTQTIGTLNMLNTFGSNKKLILGGVGTGNVVDTVTWSVTANQLSLTKAGTGSWAITNDLAFNTGGSRASRLYVEQGTLTLGGTSNFFTHRVGVATNRGTAHTASGLASKLIAKGTMTINDNREFFYVQNLGTISPGPGVQTLNVTWNANSSTSAANGAFNMQTGSTYEWDIASSTSTDVINVTTGGSNNGNLILGDLILGNMTIKIQDAGVATSIASTDQLPVFTYETGAQTVVRSINGVTLDTSALGAGWSGTPSLVDNGTGTIYVTGLSFAGGGGTTFADWRTTNGAGSQTLADDHDNDGVDNGTEYFLFGTGNSTGFTALPSVVNSAGTLSVTWTKAASYTGTYGTDFVVQTSETLADWAPEASPGTVTISGNNVTYTFPNPLGAKKFARLKVTGP